MKYIRFSNFAINMDKVTNFNMSFNEIENNYRLEIHYPFYQGYTVTKFDTKEECAQAFIFLCQFVGVDVGTPNAPDSTEESKLEIIELLDKMSKSQENIQENA